MNHRSESLTGFLCSRVTEMPENEGGQRSGIYHNNHNNTTNAHPSPPRKETSRDQKT